MMSIGACHSSGCLMSAHRVLSCLGHDPGRHHQASYRKNNGALRDQKPTALDAVVNSDTVPAGTFGSSHFGHKIFRDARKVDHLQRTHHFPLPHKRRSFCVVSDTEHNKNFFYMRQHFDGNAILYRDGTSAARSGAVQRC